MQSTTYAYKKSTLEVFNTSFDAVIVRYLDLSSLKFRNGGNFSDWQQDTVLFFLPVKSKSSFYFVRPEPETPDNPEKISFSDYREFKVPADPNEHLIHIQ